MQRGSLWLCQICKSAADYAVGFLKTDGIGASNCSKRTDDRTIQKEGKKLYVFNFSCGCRKRRKRVYRRDFSTDGWKVSFLDKDPRVTEALKQGSYIVNAHQENGDFTRVIRDYDVYLADEKYDCMKAIIECDVIALALYPEDIPEAAAYLGKGLSARVRSGGKKLTIMSCTNKNHLMPEIERAFWRHWENAEARDWFRENVAFTRCHYTAELQRRCGIFSGTGYHCGEYFALQQPVYADFSNVHWVELCDHIEQLKDIKLYTINGPHATCAYAGYLKGYKTILEASEDPEIAKLMQDVLAEAVPGLSREFQVPEEDIWNFCSLKSPKMILPIRFIGLRWIR